MSGLIGNAGLRLDIPIASHSRSHGAFHCGVVAGLPIDHAADLILALGNDQMHVNGPRLAEPPAPPHGLIPSLIREAAAHEGHAGGVLPVQAHASDGWLRDNVLCLAHGKRRQRRLFALWRM